jgi:hypothetical protein
MAYTVVWLEDGDVLETTLWQSLVSAKKHASEQFPIKQQQFGATSVEIRDDNGKTVFRLPGG